MTISELIKKGMIELKNGNIEEPKLKARLLMQYVLNKSRQYVIVNDREELDNIKEKQYLEEIKILKKGNSPAISLKIRNQTNISLRWHYPNQVIGRSSQLPLSLSTSSLFHILPLI